MRVKRHIIEILVVYAMILLLKGSLVDAMSPYSVNNDYYKENITVCDLDVIKRKFSICIIDSEEIHLFDYMERNNSFRFITNLNSSTLVGKGYVIIELSRDWNPCHPEIVLICFYKETKKDGIIKREPVYPLEEMQKSAKKIVILLISERTREVHERRMQEAAKIKNVPSRRVNIEEGLETLVRLLHICVCREYNSKMKGCGYLLENIRIANYWFYENYIKNIWVNDIKDILPNSNLFNNSLIYCGFLVWRGKDIDDLLWKNKTILEEVEKRHIIHRVDDIQYKDENSKIEQKDGVQEDIALIYTYKTIDALKNILKILKERLDYMNEVFWRNQNDEDTEIPDEYLDDKNIELSDKIISILAGIAHDEQDPKIMQKILSPIQNRVHPLIKKILGCYTESTSIKTLIKSVEENRKEIVDSFLSIVFGNQVLAESGWEDMIILKEVAREILNGFADLMHYSFAILINFAILIDSDKVICLEKIIEEEKAYLENYDVKKAIAYILEFANKFWYAPKYYSGLIDCVEKAIAQKNTLEYITKNWSSYTIEKILMFSYQAYKSINDMVTCDEIWEDPAVLYISNSSSSKERLSYFIYKENSTTYISETDFCNSNIEVIKKNNIHSYISEDLKKETHTIIEFEKNIAELKKRLCLSKHKKNRKRRRSLSSESE